MEGTKMDEMSELRLHKESIEQSTPLTIIREKELEINTKVLECKRRADDMGLEARQKAAAIKDKAAEEAPKEAQAYFDAEVKRAEKEAEKIRQSAGKEVDAVRKIGLGNFEEAVRRIRDVVVP